MLASNAFPFNYCTSSRNAATEPENVPTGTKACLLSNRDTMNWIIPVLLLLHLLSTEIKIQSAYLCKDSLETVTATRARPMQFFFTRHKSYLRIHYHLNPTLFKLTFIIYFIYIYKRCPSINQKTNRCKQKSPKRNYELLLLEKKITTFLL